MYQVGDLVRYLPYNNEHPGSWVMYGGLGIIVSIIAQSPEAPKIYKVKWLESMEDSLLPGDFLEILEI